MADEPKYIPDDAKDFTDTPVEPEVAPKNEKESKGGENPYMFVADQLEIADQLENQIQIFATSARSEDDYQALIDWEVENFTLAYKAIHGTPPIEGDLEGMLPKSEATSAAQETLPVLNDRGVQAAVVSSGFKYLVDPAVAELGIPPKNALANIFTYDQETGYMNGVEVNVSGNKVGALEKATVAFVTQGISTNEIAYVGDNDWDLDAINHILEQGGQIYYLQPGGDESAKMYPLSDASLFNNENFHVIDNLTDLMEQPEIGQTVKAIIYDADGTIIDIK